MTQHNTIQYNITQHNTTKHNTTQQNRTLRPSGSLLMVRAAENSEGEAISAIRYIGSISI